METQEEYKKILFRFYSNVLEQEMVETMWARVVDEEKGLYQIENIPFYVSSIASEDVVYATYDADEEMLVYRDTVEYSGNSTIQVVVLDEIQSANALRSDLEGMGCISEKLNEKYFVVEIPADKNYVPIRSKLKELEHQNIIDYAESCLSDKHRP